LSIILEVTENPTYPERAFDILKVFHERFLSAFLLSKLQPPNSEHGVCHGRTIGIGNVFIKIQVVGTNLLEK
jgi:hypothetical protein